MNEECLICGEKLKYLTKNIEMECAVCRRLFESNVHCEHGHYVCDACHTVGMDNVLGLCSRETSKNPIEIIIRLMHAPFCHMHGPEHHVIVGAALLTAYKNAGGQLDLPSALATMIERGRKVPGGACGFWGACGAAISSGMFISIITQSSPLTVEPWSLSNMMTSQSLARLASIGGPRCCKRDSWLSILAAIDFVAEHFDVHMEKSDVVCEFSEKNNQCIGKRCPFSKLHNAE